MLHKYIFETKLEKWLSEEDKSICDGEKTVAECSEIEFNKYPGLNHEIPSVEFYITFWEKIKYFLIKMYSINRLTYHRVQAL